MKEIRICEIRAGAAAGAEKALRLEGRPIVYDQPTKINDPAGAFIEVIRAGALEGADLSDARLLYNHDLSKVPLARTPKTMQLIHDPAGLRMVADLPDTPEANSVYTAVKRGDKRCAFPRISPDKRRGAFCDKRAGRGRKTAPGGNHKGKQNIDEGHLEKVSKTDTATKRIKRRKPK